MKLLRKILPCILLLVLGGCRPESSAGHIVLHVANWGGAGDDDKLAQTVQQLYLEFEKENPGVEVRVETIPQDYVSKMVLNFIADAQPEVMMLDFSSASIFINNGLLTDLTPFIQKDKEFKIDDFFPNAINTARKGSALYAITNDFTPMVMYFNKRLFDKAGVPYPKPRWNFQQFLATAQKLTIPGDSPDAPPKQAGFLFTNWMAGWIMWLWNNGGDVLSPDGKRAEGYLDSPQNVQTVNFLSDLIKRYHISPSLSAAAAQGVDLFADGRAAMTVSGHWSMVSYANAPKDASGKPAITWDDLGVVELPHNTPEPHTVIYESGYAMPKGCRYKDAAWKFIKFMTSHKVQELYNSTGIAICGRKDVAEEKKNNPLEAQFLSIVPSVRPPWGSKVQGNDFVESTGASAVDSILQNDTPVEVALHRAAQRIDAEFSKG